MLSSAIESLINRKEFIKTLPRGKDKVFSLVFEGGAFSVMMHALKAYRKNDTAIISELMRNNEQSISKLQKIFHHYQVISY